jgi:hypothetical protein
VKVLSPRQLAISFGVLLLIIALAVTMFSFSRLSYSAPHHIAPPMADIEPWDIHMDLQYMCEHPYNMQWYQQNCTVMT